jgi:simple sugar transport system ATP-binding protein
MAEVEKGSSVDAVSMRGISRRFGTVQALDGVDLGVANGEIHAVIGENGAGKTTLMRILYGADRADAGQIIINGAERRFHSAAEGIAAGIGMVSQHYSIIPELTCLENLMLGAEPNLWIDAKSALERAEALARQMGFQFNWLEPAERLSPAAAQKLEILKLLWRDSRIMILDEPTAMLSPADSDSLYESLKTLASRGATVLVVTHRIPEILDHCRRATILRGGRLVESRDLAGTSSAELAELIVGRAVDDRQPRTQTIADSAALTVHSLTVRGRRGDPAVSGASFSGNKGEILGIAGVEGSGQRELFWALCGVLRPESGTIAFDSLDITASHAAERVKLGFRLIPEDRHDEGVVDDWPLEENAVLGLQRLEAFSSGPWIRVEARHSAALAIAERFSTRHGGLGEPISSLSGGNQQRFVAARALEVEPRVILAFQPARGLDILGTRQVYEGIAEACRGGACAIIVGFDLDELLESCDRIGVLCQGRYAEPPSGFERDRATIGRLMVGVQ